MVQRLGRVNRRGKKVSRVDVIAAPRERDKPEVWGERLTRLRAPLELLLRGEDGARDASPGALVALKERPSVQEAIDTATTPAPLRPALAREPIDAWSLTSLDEHTGRSDVQPWLRGWVSEDPQTTVAWRRWLPWRKGLDKPLEADVDRFFAAAPVHLEETLETEIYHVFDTLMARAAAALEVARAEEGGDRDPPRPALLILAVDGKHREACRCKTLRGWARRRGRGRGAGTDGSRGPV